MEAMPRGAKNCTHLATLRSSRISADTLRMTGFSARARGHDQHLLKTPETKVTEKANKKQILYFASYSPPFTKGSNANLGVASSPIRCAHKREDFMIPF
jgi:hypothetical protein